MKDSALLPDRVDHLAPRSRELLRSLAERPWCLDLYLAGSAALALYLGHRTVRDLDLMGVRRLRSPERRDLLQDLLEIEPGVRVETARDGYFYLRFPGEWDDLALRMFYYPYPLVGAEEEAQGMAVASALDLGLMKLGAVTSRAARRDFVDLCLLCRHLPLEELLDRAPEKFGHVRDFPLQALKGLADLDSARDEPLRQLEVDLEWSDVEAWVRGEVREVARRRIGLDEPDDGSGTVNPENEG